MKQVKKILAAVLALLMVLVLASCGSVGENAYAGRIDSDNGNADFKLDKRSGILNVEATKVVMDASSSQTGSSAQTQTGNGQQQGTTSFDPSTALINYRNFKDNKELNYYLITGDNYVFCDAIRNGTIRKMIVTFPDNSSQGQQVYTFTRNSKGQVIGVSLSGQKFNYKYDAQGRLVEKSAYASGYRIYTIVYTYDKAGNIATVTESISKDYLTAVYQQQIAQDITSSLKVNYDKQGRVSGMSAKGGASSKYTYNSKNQLTGISSMGNSATASNTFTYDKKGNLIKMTSSSSSNSSDESATYEFSKFKSY